MFKNVLETTPLTSEAANAYFESITGYQIFGDSSFVGTLRALVAPRMKEGERVQLCFKQSNYGANVVKDHPAKRVLEAMIGDSPAMYRGNTGIIQIHNCNNVNSSDNARVLEMVKNSYTEHYEGWYALPKVTEFFRKTFNVLCFINPDTRNVMLFTEMLDIRRLHYLQCSIFAFMPWYFDPSVGVTEIEMALIQSLREKTPENYLSCMNAIASQYDFRSGKIRKLLEGFETVFERQELENAQRNIRGVRENIEDLNDRLADYLRQQRDLNNKILGLEMSIQQGGGESEIMEYFLCNKKLVLEERSGTEMTFGVMDYLTYFDEEMAKTMIDNQRSYVYRPNGDDMSRYMPRDDMKLLMYALFIDQTVRMRMCSAYHFRMDGTVRALDNHHYGCEYVDCTPNTHIDRYRCLGDHQRTINRLLADRNYIGALEQAVSSCKSLNFGDSPVMNEFMYRLYGARDGINIKCIELPDGKVVKPKEAVAWLKAQANAAAEAQAAANTEEANENE